jgi:hypothetical protein
MDLIGTVRAGPKALNSETVKEEIMIGLFPCKDF